MVFAVASSFFLQSCFPSSSPLSSLTQSVLFYAKTNNAETYRRKKRTRIAACIRQEDPNEVTFSKKRMVLFVGISVLPFLQLRSRAGEGLIAKEGELKIPEKSQKAELAIQLPKLPNRFLSLLNGLGIFGTGLLGALYALAQKEKKTTDATLESMTATLREKEHAITFLEKNFESRLLNEQEERRKQLEKSKEEQQFLVNQLNLANSTIAGLGQELKNKKQIIEELNVQIDGLENNLSKAGEDKTAFERELEEKLNLTEVFQDKINLLTLELKDKEDNVQNIRSLLTEKELELKSLNSTYKQTEEELAKARTEINCLKDELLKNQKELESKNCVVDELNLSVSSLIVERDESNRKLNAIREEYNDLKLSSETKAALNAKTLGDREDELQQLKEKLELAQNEVSGSRTMIVDLTRERDDLRKKLDTELINVKNMKQELQITQEALGKSRNDASDLEKQLKESRIKCTGLEGDVSRAQTEFIKATETLQMSLEKTKQDSEVLASEIMAVKEQLKKTKDELEMLSHELANVRKNRDSIRKELVDVCKKAEVSANELEEEKNVASSLNKEMQNLEKQILKDREARKSLEVDLEEATKSLDEMNRNVLILSGDLEMANSRICSLEDEKQVLYMSLTEQKNASKEAQESMEDVHNIVLRLGQERESLEKKAKKLEKELASAKGEILRLRSQINSSKILVNDQNSKKDEAEEKVTVNAKRTARRKKTGPQ